MENTSNLFDGILPLKVSVHDEMDETGNFVQVIDDSGLRGIASIYGERRRERAQVFAAAPDLLEALISLAAAARRHLPDYDEHPEIQKAESAIAKAKGEVAS